ncbi:hypothetical protein [Peptoniphilus gorbachii]|uniref:Uncharacterized protein n=1 Tax=Peptoniphilus gorbachii TaxID=411567 RepID=A0ABS2MKG0_9FIRM|nr:hypothetical protein [Peptoniphilus gorbachii]MBM7550501.1 hypothetical protein [Peptoniphilus gorbachii]MDU1582496.1 hypothetical protein [Peptoniphilus harei]MDU1663778.1 hypothetical protein [Peptoniphilus harei]
MTTYKWGKFEKKSFKSGYEEEYLGYFSRMGIRNGDPWQKILGIGYYKGQFCYCAGDSDIDYREKLFESKYIPGCILAISDEYRGGLPYKADFLEFGTFNGDYHKSNFRIVNGQVEKSGSSKGPSEYISGDVYYIKDKITYNRGSRLDTVTSTNRNAYPNDGKSGSYWYVYEGIANQEPTISGQDEDWGGYKQAFKRYYSVDDGDSGQQLNVTVTLNGVTIASVNNATRKSDYPIDIDDSKFNALTLNEQNTIEITVTDSSGATAVRRYTFKRINTAPVVTMTNAHYGEQNKPFTINFEAADPDGDEITAKLFIDDVQIKDLGTIKGKQSVTIPKIDFAKIPNGEHKIRVEAKDSYNAVGVGYADFSKNLTYAWYRLKKELSEQPSAVIVNPLAELAPGAKMTIKVCSNVMDAQPTWETVPEELYGQKYNFRNTSKTAAKWGVGVEIRIDKEKATEEFYLYGFVGAYM